jgi:uncharacterized iron-regulated protein
MLSMKNHPLWPFLILLGSSLLFACVKKAPLPAWYLNIQATKETIGAEEVFRLPEDEKISFAQLLDDLDKARLIFVGENHDQVEHHQNQVKVLRGLIQKGKDVVIGMEMFERAHQPVLDRWSKGLLTEEEFLKETDWETTWGIDYELYKPILDDIKEKHLKLLGLNVQRDLVRKVGKNGIQGLSPEERKRLPEMDLTDRAHRAYVGSIYRQHHGGEAKEFDSFYQAQCLWDEGMAETLAEFLRSPEGQGKAVLVFAGNGHIIFDFGIPKRVYRRISIPYKTIVLKEWQKGRDNDLTFSGASSPLASFLWITRPNPPEKKRPRIGVMLRDAEGLKGLSIERVIPESPAEKAGLLPGDQLIAVEGKEIAKIKEIHEALDQKGWGKEVTFTILRNGEKKEIKVTLPPSQE